MSERVIAVLQWMGGEHGYGFLVEQEGKEVFVHYDPIQGEGFRILTEGSKCAFSIENGRKGPTAVNIYQPAAMMTPRIDRDF
jgi:cold shock protein